MKNIIKMLEDRILEVSNKRSWSIEDAARNSARVEELETVLEDLKIIQTAKNTVVRLVIDAEVDEIRVPVFKAAEPIEVKGVYPTFYAETKPYIIVLFQRETAGSHNWIFKSIEK